MPPICEEEGRVTREELLELRKKNRCQVCGGMLNVFLDSDSGKVFLACNDWHRTHHDGIEREVIPYEVNIPTRRQDMEQGLGSEKATALAKYIGAGIITKKIATDIVETMWGEAPLIEKTKAILLCQTYQLNPLMKHIHLVGYRRRDAHGEFILDAQGKEVKDWVLMVGVGATRLMAQRKHIYSYLDLSPRRATQEEIDKILGDTADPNCIYGFTHVKDMRTGAEAFGLRGISKTEKIKGADKGNTHLNLACIRSERLALDRQYPGEMPQGLDVVDERFIDAEYTVTEETTGGWELPTQSTAGDEKTGKPPAEENREEGKGDETDLSSPKVATDSKKIGASAAEPMKPEGPLIDPTWLNESLKQLKWSNNTCKSFLSQFEVSTEGSLEEVLTKLTRYNAEEFVKKIQQKIDQLQPGLF